MQGERRPSQKLSIPPVPADARLRSGVAPLGETPRTAGEAQAGRTSVDGPYPRAPNLTVPVLPTPVFEAALELEISLAPDWDDEDLSTRVFDRPPELVAALAKHEELPEPAPEVTAAPKVTQTEPARVLREAEAETTATPRVTQRELERVRKRLKWHAALGRAGTLLRRVSVRPSRRLTKLLLVSGLLAGCTFSWLYADVPQLLGRARSALGAWQATDGAKLRSVQGR